MLMLIILSVAFLVFAFDSALVIFIHRQALGKFDVTSISNGVFAFTTSVGEYKIENSIAEIQCRLNSARLAIKFAQIRTLEISIESKCATLDDLLLDLEINKNWHAEKNIIEINTVSIVSYSGIVIPIFRSGKYVSRKYWHDSYTKIQLAILEHLGLTTNVDDQCRKVVDELQARLGAPPVSHWRIRL